jgi:hypothetical protein
MPKKSSKRQIARNAKAATDGTDDDFDLMLAEVMAVDPQPTDADRAQTGRTASSTSVGTRGDKSSSSSGSSSSCNSHASSTPEITAQLQQWKRQGVRVQSAEPLIFSVIEGTPTNVLRCLIHELGADVNLARTFTDGHERTAVFVAAEFGFLAVVRLLVKELGADVNQAANG